MRESKLVRESLRILLQATSKCPCLFTDKFCRRVKRKWNLIQFEELQKIPHVSPVNRHDVVHADLTCTSGDGETVHPSVLYFPNGWGIGNWKYLMAVTPFPNGIVYFENPEFVVSNDGISWSLPSQNAPSPVVPPPSEWTGYNSDPNLCYDAETETLFLFYREVRENRNSLTVTIFVKSTVDGILWSRPIPVKVVKTPSTIGTVLLSPSVLKLDDTAYIWYVEKTDGRYCMKRSECRSLSAIEPSVVCKVVGIPEGLSLWHIEVKEDVDGRLVMSACVTDELTKIRSIIFAESCDNGLTWRVLPTKLDPEPNCRERSLYKASLIKEGGGCRWRLYYSYHDVDGHWFTAVRNVSL